MVRWSFGDWVVVLTLLGLAFAFGWLDRENPKVIYTPVPDNEIHINSPAPP